MTYNQFFGYTIIFSLSVFLACVLSMLENLAGIAWDFHPDARFYITNSQTYVEQWNANFVTKNLLNNGYFYMVDFLSADRFILVLLNINLYAVTNTILFSAFLRFHRRCTSEYTRIYFILVFIILFDPYRMHLSIYVLKDTIIIFLSVMFVCYSSYLRVCMFLLGLFMRKFFVVNIFLAMRKNFILVIFTAFIFLAFFNIDIFIDTIMALNTVDMNTRSVDTMPSYFNEGVIGVIKRSLLWPVLYLSGSFVFYIKSPMYLPIFFEVVAITIFRLMFIGRRYSDYRLFVVLFLLGIPVSAFTAYARYALPIIIMFLLFDLKNHAIRKT